MPTDKGKHVTYTDRCDIELGLRDGMRLSDIARCIGVAPSTVTREITRNRTDTGYRTSFNSTANHCYNRRECSIKNACGGRSCRSECKNCKNAKCDTVCPEFKEIVCSKIAHGTHCCNGCHAYRTCTKHRYTYHAKEAQLQSEKRLVQSRAGINATPQSIEYMVTLVKRLSAQNQSLAHIWVTHADEMPCSARSFYRHQARGYFNMTNLEFPRKSCYKIRTKTEYPRFFSDLGGRTYKEYLKLDEQTRQSVVQIDCVEGRQRDKQALLTLHFLRCNFQIGVLLAEKTQDEVKRALDWIESLCEGRFIEIFGLILTDRGSEFRDYAKIETSSDGSARCAVYYCDPCQSSQKGSCEKNHVEFRKILPKKRTDFDALTPWHLATINSHINSYTRKSLGGASPLALVSQVLPKSLLEGLGITLIAPDAVTLTPALLSE